VRTVHRVILSVFTLGVIVQFFLAGLGVFRVQDGASSSRFDHVFEPHRVLGNVLLIVALLVLLGLVLTLLVFLQSVLANAGPSWVRAIHPVVAVLILALAGSFTGRLWREQRAGLS
jgi:hypothetical protein